ncbi:hypothetical protein M422DRAFT_45421 [Sphaerobolus stellatus SS14]|nr:hypothetical protein M422DRAFT_45421 [Sphaerobolus stellatus SS14]
MNKATKRRQIKPPGASNNDTLISLNSSILDSCKFTFTFPSAQAQLQNLAGLSNMQTQERIPNQESLPMSIPPSVIDPSLVTSDTISASTPLRISEKGSLQGSLAILNLHSYEI